MRPGELDYWADEVEEPLVVRWAAFDAFRGLAILSMMVDHLVLVSGGPVLLRETVGRLAVPAFFLLAGHLAARPRWRHAGVGVVGLVLPVFVPWIDSPNVLVVWSLAVVLLWACTELGIPVWVLAVAALTAFANGWGQIPGAYPPAALVGLMAVGALVDRSAFAWAGRAPGWVAWMGRHPVAWYVGHLAVLQLVLVAVAW